MFWANASDSQETEPFAEEQLEVSRVDGLPEEELESNFQFVGVGTAPTREPMNSTPTTTPAKDFSFILAYPCSRHGPSSVSSVSWQAGTIPRHPILIELPI